MVGFAARHFEVFPCPQLASVKLVAENWRSEFGIEPTKLLVPASDPDRRLVVTCAEDRLAPGHVLISGLISDEEALFGVGLFDREGTRINFWPVDPTERIEAIRDRTVFDVFLHGVAVHHDGTLFANFDPINGSVRVSACGELECSAPNNTHDFDG